jgi:hypothetical protein
MNPLSSSWWLSLAAAFLAGAILGGVFIETLSAKEIAQLHEKQATAQALADHTALARWKAATLRADAAENRLAQQNLTQQHSLEDKKHGLSAVVSGRPCLSSGAVGLLNGSAASAGLRLPPPAAQLDPAAAAFASDSDVGNWIAIAQSQYEQCRNTRQALIEWLHD